MSIAVTEPFRILALVTAFARSCVVPTLFGGNTASRAASPSGVQPRTATTSAATDTAVEARLGISIPLFRRRKSSVHHRIAYHKLHAVYCAPRPATDCP